MSITLMAYPMAFLIEPEKAKNETLKLASCHSILNETAAKKNLKYIKVLTNLEYKHIKYLMQLIDCSEIQKDVYYLPSGVTVEWVNRGKYLYANIGGNVSSKILQIEGESFFKNLDSIAGKNVRLINSFEFFYYDYDTSYTSIPQIYSALKEQGAEQIFSTSDNEIIANLNGQNIKYFRRLQDETFTLEVEQKISILNIGDVGEVEGITITTGLTNLKIKTNIKPEELKKLLEKANYLFYELNGQTPLKNSNATLNWVLKNGYYIAEFSGANNTAITKEAEIIFRKLNIAAGRDLRFVNDTSTAVYTYATNYTDKGILLNTLIEHGAQEISEIGDEVSCVLFGMEMIYYKKNQSNGYTLDITQISDKSECEDLIKDLNEEYGLNIQEMTYNKIKERLEKENMCLESEVIMEDNSIVLTIDI